MGDFIELGGLIDEIKFKSESVKKVRQINLSFLEALIEGNKDIRFDLSTAGRIGFACEYESCSINIVGANFETDIFNDYINLYSFPNLKILTLTCHNREVEHLKDKDLSAMQLALFNLENLNTLILDLVGMRENLIEQVKQLIIFPQTDLDVIFVESKKDRLRCIKNMDKKRLL